MWFGPFQTLIGAGPYGKQILRLLRPFPLDNLAAASKMAILMRRSPD